MGKTKLKVNAKNFVRDYRAGLSDDELIRTYSLSRDSLDKLLKMLVDKDLLDPSELQSGAMFPSTELLDIPEFGELTFGRRENSAFKPRPTPRPQPVMEPPRVDEETKPETKKEPDSSKCPQCSAGITDKMLICSECGHVLPGEERWANVEPQGRLVDRIPPKVLGTVVALPIAVALFFVFRDIILPMTDATIENRSRSIQTSDPGRSRTRSAAAMVTKEEADAALDQMVDDLIRGKVFEDANQDLTVFSVGPRWWDMSGDERLDTLDRLRKAMRLSMMEFEVEIIDSLGQAVALVNHNSVDLLSQ
jgi:hypothetical protein